MNGLKRPSQHLENGFCGYHPGRRLPGPPSAVARHSMAARENVLRSLIVAAGTVSRNKLKQASSAFANRQFIALPTRHRVLMNANLLRQFLLGEAKLCPNASNLFALHDCASSGAQMLSIALRSALRPLLSAVPNKPPPPAVRHARRKLIRSRVP